MIKDSDKKQLGEKKSLFHLTLLNHSPNGSKWQPEIEIVEKQGLLAHFLACSVIGCYFSYIVWDHLPKDGATDSGLSPLV